MKARSQGSECEGKKRIEDEWSAASLGRLCSMVNKACGELSAVGENIRLNLQERVHSAGVCHGRADMASIPKLPLRLCLLFGCGNRIPTTCG